MSNETRIHRLPDDRRLAYAEFGDPAGRPVLLVHGNPGSRLFWSRLAGAPFGPGLRLIAPDRPGVGFSDFGKGRTVADWPDDVASLVSTLGIEKIDLLGVSAGGPYALACAWKIPHLLGSVGVFAPMGPYLPETIAGLVPSLAKLYRVAPRHPRLIRLQMGIMALLSRWLPALYVKLVTREFSATDMAAYRRLDLAHRIVPDRREFYRQWGRGAAYDVTIPATWPIPLAEITLPVFLWQGELDTAVPPSSSRYLATQIPDCHATFIPNAGHFWIFEHVGDVLGTLVADNGGS